MATYTSNYTGAQIDAGIGSATLYVCGTSLSTGAAGGTITSATALISAIGAKAPIDFTIGSTHVICTCNYLLDTYGDYTANYIGIRGDTLESTIYSIELSTASGTVTYHVYTQVFPVPDSTDTGKVLVVSSTDGEYEIGGTLPTAATSAVLGTIKLGSDTQQSVAANAVSSTSLRTYALQKNSSGQGVVNVPWTDTTKAENVNYTTSAPASDNADGLKFTVLSTDPVNKYNGWVYLITSGS